MLTEQKTTVMKQKRTKFDQNDKPTVFVCVIFIHITMSLVSW